MSQNTKLAKVFNLFEKRLAKNDELELAKQIQTHLFPKSFPFPQYIDVGTLYEPSKYIGGDFYDVIQIDDRKVAFLMGDVAGYSIPAALFMTQCLTLLKAFIKMDLSLLKVAEKTNQILYDLAKADMFATVFIAIYDSHYNQLSFINAGHNPPLLIRTAKNIPERTLSMITAEGIALNCLPKITLEEKRIQLYGGDILLMYTDGIIEARNEKDEIFGESKLKGLMVELKDLPAQQIIERIFETYKDYTASTKDRDDIAALVIKFKKRS